MRKKLAIPTQSIIDAHCHINAPEFDSDRESVLGRAEAAGICRIVAVGETLEDARKNLHLSDVFAIVSAGAGLYPTILDLDQAEQMIEFIDANQQDLVCIGEVGLDFWKVQDEADREIQKEVFRRFIGISKKSGLPLNVHSRSAGRHAIQLLIDENARHVQLHAFDGKASAALEAVDAGFFFSIPPSIVRSRQKQKLVKNLPLSSILLESDAPVLAPRQGDRNEPANIILAAKAIAEIKNVTLDHVIHNAFDNTRNLYGPKLLI
ncbi:TatD family hydrolase [bacterium]|nr:TatD family hydrolase [candidate division CSSED10-310 bacterium]